MLRISFQGERGAYSEKASSLFFKDCEVKFFPCETFRDTFESLSNNNADYAVLPIENSLAGSIHENYDLLREFNFHIVGEQVIRVSHNLIVTKNAELTDIKEVYSHPQALAQSSNFFLANKQINKIPYYDTAGAAKMVSEVQDKSKAAIASDKASEIYDLKIIKKAIENDKTNFTRFIVVSKEKLPSSRIDDLLYKTSIVFSLKNIPGALFKSLSAFSLRDIDLTKIESRPLVGTPWEYLFYLDFKGHYTDKYVSNALNDLNEVAENINIFGSYKIFNQEK